MKLSISLSAEDLALVDEYVKSAGLESRSAAIQHALRLLRQADLEEDYAQAWEEWAASGDQADWDSTAADGLTDAAR